MAKRHDFGHEFVNDRIYAKDIKKLPPGTMVRLIWKDSVMGEMWSLYRVTDDHRLQNLNFLHSIIEPENRPGTFYVKVKDGERWEERLRGIRDEQGRAKKD